MFQERGNSLELCDRRNQLAVSSQLWNSAELYSWSGHGGFFVFVCSVFFVADTKHLKIIVENSVAILSAERVFNFSVASMDQKFL
jgi:hypothetical protein